jgi:hypothetical protein
MFSDIGCIFLHIPFKTRTIHKLNWLQYLVHFIGEMSVLLGALTDLSHPASYLRSGVT